MLPDPDFTQTCFPAIEEKLGRKLTIEENKNFLYRGGMFKEWFFNELKECTTIEQAERLFAKALAPWAVYTPKRTNLLSKILDWLSS